METFKQILDVLVIVAIVLVAINVNFLSKKVDKLEKQIKKGE